MRAGAIAVLLLVGCSSEAPPDDPEACVDRATPEVAYNHIIAPGGSLAGTACLSCHREASAGVFDFAGTVLDRAGNPEAGVHIRLRDFFNRVQVVATDDAGNFFVPGGSGMEFPVVADISDCPTVVRMNPQIVSAMQGDCNMCHDGGALARINLDR